MATPHARPKSAPISCITRWSRCTAPAARSPTCAGRSRPGSAHPGADPWPTRSESRDETAIELGRIADIGEAEVLQILPGHAAHVVGGDAPQVVHEAIRGAIVAFEHLGAREDVRLIGVRLVLEVVL